MSITVTNTWPVALPLPNVGYTGEPRYAVTMSPSRYENKQKRSRAAKSYRTITVEWVLTDAQFEAFEEFNVTTLGNGTAAFSIDLRYPLNSALSNWMVRFASDYQASKVDFFWQVQAQFDLISGTTLPDVATIV